MREQMRKLINLLESDNNNHHISTTDALKELIDAVKRTHPDLHEREELHDLAQAVLAATAVFVKAKNEEIGVPRLPQ